MNIAWGICMQLLMSSGMGWWTAAIHKHLQMFARGMAWFYAANLTTMILEVKDFCVLSGMIVLHYQLNQTGSSINENCLRDLDAALHVFMSSGMGCMPHATNVQNRKGSSIHLQERTMGVVNCWRCCHLCWKPLLHKQVGEMCQSAAGFGWGMDWFYAANLTTMILEVKDCCVLSGIIVLHYQLNQTGSSITIK